jgi:hypothetical protein
MECQLVKITQTNNPVYQHLRGTLAIAYPGAQPFPLLRLQKPDPGLGGRCYVPRSAVEFDVIRDTTFDDFSLKGAV